MSLKKINVALVGLGFGGAFAEIYKEHPMVGELAVFDTDKALEKTFREKLGIKKEYANTFNQNVCHTGLKAISDHIVSPRKRDISCMNSRRRRWLIGMTLPSCNVSLVCSIRSICSPLTR